MNSVLQLDDELPEEINNIIICHQTSAENIMQCYDNFIIGHDRVVYSVSNSVFTAVTGYWHYGAFGYQHLTSSLIFKT